VQATCADVSELVKAIDYKPAMSVEEGMSRFVDWYMDYYKP
jgi:UDP-glucuronate 4-epimerase